MTPIKIEQTTLNKYLPGLKINPLTNDKKRLKTKSINRNYTLRSTPDNTIYIKETHCLECGKRLRCNGHNPRKAILDMGGGRWEYRLHRKRCKRCGEIKPDYSKMAPKFGNYHENYKRKARQHYMEGLNPAQIKKVFKIDFGITIAKSSIVKWVNEVSEPLRRMLCETPVPSSGCWGYDEIHMSMRGKKMYAINTVDMNTHFVPIAKISEKMGRDVGRETLLEGRRGQKEWLNALVKDCTANLGGLFRTRSFKHIVQQNCLTHVKWIISAHIKAFAGMSKQSKKPIPKELLWLVKRFYKVLDSGTETEAFIGVEIIRRTVERLQGKRIHELYVALRQLESWLPKIIAHQRNPNIPKTNNRTEGYHKKYEHYRAFKTQMMTKQGAQRVLDYRVFNHNFGRFPLHKKLLDDRYQQARSFALEFPNQQGIRGYGSYFKAQFKKVNNWYGNYVEVWDEYFAIKKD